MKRNKLAVQTGFSDAGRYLGQSAAVLSIENLQRKIAKLLYDNNLTKVKLPFEPNLIAQVGASGAINDHPHLERTVSENEVEYKRLFEYLDQNGFSPIPSVTNFICIKTGSAEKSTWLFENLLNQGVIIRPLSSNEMPDFVRISIGTKEEMDHFYEAMDTIISEYKKL